MILWNGGPHVSDFERRMSPPRPLKVVLLVTVASAAIAAWGAIVMEWMR